MSKFLAHDDDDNAIAATAAAAAFNGNPKTIAIPQGFSKNCQANNKQIRH